MGLNFYARLHCDLLVLFMSKVVSVELYIYLLFVRLTMIHDVMCCVIYSYAGRITGSLSLPLLRQQQAEAAEHHHRTPQKE